MDTINMIKAKSEKSLCENWDLSDLKEGSYRLLNIGGPTNPDLWVKDGIIRFFNRSNGISVQAGNSYGDWTEAAYEYKEVFPVTIRISCRTREKVLWSKTASTSEEILKVISECHTEAEYALIDFIDNNEYQEDQYLYRYNGSVGEFYPGFAIGLSDGIGFSNNPQLRRTSVGNWKGQADTLLVPSKEDCTKVYVNNDSQGWTTLDKKLARLKYLKECLRKKVGERGSWYKGEVSREHKREEDYYKAKIKEIENNEDLKLLELGLL